MAVITRWSYKQGGRKAGFHCSGVRAAQPLAVFPAHIYLPRPHYMNAWNSLQTSVKGD